MDIRNDVLGIRSKKRGEKDPMPGDSDGQQEDRGSRTTQQQEQEHLTAVGLLTISDTSRSLPLFQEEALDSAQGSLS
jgi:hypothetical protein